MSKSDIKIINSIDEGNSYIMNGGELSEFLNTTSNGDTYKYSNVIVAPFRVTSVIKTLALLSYIDVQYAFQEVDGYITITLFNINNSKLYIFISGKSFTTENDPLHCSLMNSAFKRIVDKLVEYYVDKEPPSMSNLITYNHTISIDDETLESVEDEINEYNRKIRELMQSVRAYMYKVGKLEEKVELIKGVDGRVLSDIDDDISSPLNVVGEYAMWDIPPMSNTIKSSDNCNNVNDGEALAILCMNDELPLGNEEVTFDNLHDLENSGRLDDLIEEYSNEIDEFHDNGRLFKTGRMTIAVKMSEFQTTSFNLIPHDVYSGLVTAHPHMIHRRDVSFKRAHGACLGNQATPVTSAIKDRNVGELKALASTFMCSVDMTDSVGCTFPRHNDNYVLDMDDIPDIVELCNVEEKPLPDGTIDDVADGDSVDADDLWELFHN